MFSFDIICWACFGLSFYCVCAVCVCACVCVCVCACVRSCVCDFRYRQGLDGWAAISGALNPKEWCQISVRESSSWFTYNSLCQWMTLLVSDECN